MEKILGLIPEKVRPYIIWAVAIWSIAGPFAGSAWQSQQSRNEALLKITSDFKNSSANFENIARRMINDNPYDGISPKLFKEYESFVSSQITEMNKIRPHLSGDAERSIVKYEDGILTARRLFSKNLAISDTKLLDRTLSETALARDLLFKKLPLHKQQINPT